MEISKISMEDGPAYALPEGLLAKIEGVPSEQYEFT